MRALALAVCALAAGCVSAAAARRVQIVGEKPPAACRIVAERLRGQGADNNGAMMALRRNAAQGGATHVVVTDGPRAGGDGVTVDAIGYACPQTMQ